MSTDAKSLEVKHNREQNRFEIDLGGGKLAVAEYRLRQQVYIFTHTEVPPEFGGQGIANHLAKAALESVQAEGFKVLPLCPFIKAYIARHAEYQPLVAETA
ncbi:MAG: N-acetyltransferase [Anaerolineae bacterium]|nr:N-acetyltransferase [Anaerolineae bacterium]